MKDVAYLGIPGSYSFIAGIKYFGKKKNMIATKSISEVFQKVAQDECSFGVVPLENSNTGSIVETFDGLINHGLSIIGEVILKIHHHLLINQEAPDTPRGWPDSQIKTCYSHPQAISQCESFLASNPRIKTAFTLDTATAAKLVGERGRDDEAAIAGREAARIYGLYIFKRNIEENKNNFTRFAVIGKSQNKTGDKISLAFSVEHVPGSLFKALRPYAEHGLNLTKIESRPVFGKPWEYIFFLDFVINDKEKELEETIQEMKEVCSFVNVLGKYNIGRIYET